MVTQHKIFGNSGFPAGLPPTPAMELLELIAGGNTTERSLTPFFVDFTTIIDFHRKYTLQIQSEESATPVKMG